MAHDKIFSALTLPESDVMDDILSGLAWDDELQKQTKAYGVELVERIRKTRRKTTSLESFFEQYDLTTKEGLALMSLAEALLRIPDAANASALIRDKVSGTNWLQGNSKNWMTKAAGLGLKISSGTMDSLLGKIGEPFIRQAMMKAMELLGKQFVVGEDLAKALKSAKKWEEKGFSFSYDMLGEGARTSAQAEKYFDSYHDALTQIAQAKLKNLSLKANISVKLSALYPRYDYAHQEDAVAAITDKLITLCFLAAENDICLTVDAEEIARLCPSLKIIEAVCTHTHLRGWNGFGVAVQAYHKAAMPLIDTLIETAKLSGRNLRIRLVKGAYWDTEIRHSQLSGHDQYGVFTRKSNSDVSYLRCVQKLLRNRKNIYPMFGTHNAHTVAAIIKMAKNDVTGFEFQKLYGMGDALYKHIMADHDVAVTMYAPVGPYNELLPYLVRRMLENGANSSFVHQLYDKKVTPELLVQDPVLKVRNNEPKHHPKIPLPFHIYGQKRLNSKGWDFDNPFIIEPLLKKIKGYSTKDDYKAMPLINGSQKHKGTRYDVYSPADSLDKIGEVFYTNTEAVENIFSQAQKGYNEWRSRSVFERIRAIEKLALLLEENKEELISLCVREAGRTIKDAHDEIREAVDFCHYYATNAARDFNEAGRFLTSPTGETNIYTLESKGIFVCISPWNFPIAIYLGQITAALLAGNSVIAKPAEQTSILGYYLARLIHQAGVPKSSFQFVTGDGDLGALLVSHEKVSGVAFTGSTQVAKSINQSLANHEGAIPKLIAETGGQNAFIVDSSALTEQVIDDVVQSAFGSAGQRCSAARILYVQQDVYDKTVEMLKGAMAEITVGHPKDINHDLGPLISEEAFRDVLHHKTKLSGLGKMIAQTPVDDAVKRTGHYFSPTAYGVSDLNYLKTEVFGPILHVIPFDYKDIKQVVDDINALGFGLTFGIHSRVQSFVDKVCARIDCGNVYINRPITGAVVGVQPFGGHGLSGTGPKAGGPLYLHAFANEKLISTDITAAGGNASLVMLDEEDNQ